MKDFDWNEEKNKQLKEERGVCFEDVQNSIVERGALDIIPHPNKDKYPDQKLYIVYIAGYVYMVPFVEDGEKQFLKTIIPSRKLKKLYKDKIKE